MRRLGWLLLAVQGVLAVLSGVRVGLEHVHDAHHGIDYVEIIHGPGYTDVVAC
jgi:hypothetical protein